MLKNSIPPDRTWASRSLSPPSWLLGKTAMSTRPSLSRLIRSVASRARTCSGWLAGKPWPNFQPNSAARTRYTKGPAIAMVAAAAVVAVRKCLRLMSMIASSRLFPAGLRPAAMSV